MNDTSAIWTMRERHEWKNFDFGNARVKTYFHTHILAISQMKDYKERNDFILRTNFWKCLVPYQKPFKKRRTKTELYNDKSYITQWQKLYQKVIH